jgi:hypothetical protein
VDFHVDADAGNLAAHADAHPRRVLGLSQAVVNKVIKVTVIAPRIR